MKNLNEKIVKTTKNTKSLDAFKSAALSNGEKKGVKGGSSEIIILEDTLDG